MGGVTLAESADVVLPDSTSEGLSSLACLYRERREGEGREGEREREDIQCLPVFLVYPPQVPVQPRLAVKCILASSDGTLELLRLTMDGLDVHQEVVANTEATPTFLTLHVCVCEEV